MIATTIKGEYLRQIEAGLKPIDYRAASPFWKYRIEGRLHRSIIFLSGRKAKAFIVNKIVLVSTPPEYAHIIDTADCYAIHLGGAYHWPKQERLFNELA